MGTCCVKSKCADNASVHPLIQYYDNVALNYNLTTVHNFLCACETGNMHEIFLACKKNPNIIHAKCYLFTYPDGIKTCNWRGHNSFMVACIKGNVEVMKYLYLRDKTVANCVDDEGNTIFDYELKNNPKLVKFMVNIKKDLNKFKLDKCSFCESKIIKVQKIYGITNIECPICISDAEIPVVTNCGHIYCEKCISK